MEYDSSWYRPAEFVCLLLSTVLQIVCITAPGWQIHSETFGGDSDVAGSDDNAALNLQIQRYYAAIFYSTKCNASACVTKTLHDRHLEWISHKESNNDTRYHKQVAVQVTVMVAFLITVTCLGFQLRMLRKKYSKFMLTTAISGVSLSFAAGLMIHHLMVYTVAESHNLELATVDAHFSISLPYCAILYVIACLVTVLIVLLNVTEIARMRPKRLEDEQKLSSEGVAMSAAGLDNPVMADKSNSWSTLT